MYSICTCLSSYCYDPICHTTYTYLSSYDAMQSCPIFFEGVYVSLCSLYNLSKIYWSVIGAPVFSSEVTVLFHCGTSTVILWCPIEWKCSTQICIPRQLYLSLRPCLEKEGKQCTLVVHVNRDPRDPRDSVTP